MGTEIYRRGKLGDSLVDVLDEMVSGGKLPPNLAMEILRQFDNSFVTCIEKKVTAKGSFKGKLDVYRYIDNVWTMVASDTTFKLSPTAGSSKKDEEQLDGGTVRLVLVDAKVIKVEEAK